MVKADVRRDYYADLGLTPSAETEEIKRQFRKLALKYHPDRNPGREVEFISKFQAIQAAHEILIDPQQRLRYDTDRLRAGYGKFYGPSKTSSPRKTATTPQTSTYSPKPAPTKPHPSARPQSFHAGPSSGAQRYASYARAAPKQPWEKTHDEGQTRADAYRGFQEMKGNGMPGGWSSFDPRTGRAGQPEATPRPKANGPSTRPKSAFEYFRTSNKPESPEPSRTQTRKKKHGFAPHSAGGDEPMATHTSSYTSRNERSQTPNAYFGAAPSPTAKKAAQNRTDTPDFERMRSRYASAGGERTFFDSANLGRSASMRDSTESPKPRSRTNPPSPTAHEAGRYRSASPKFKADKNRNYSSTSSSDLEDEEDFLARKPKAVPKSRLHPHGNFTAFHTEHTQAAGPEPHANDTTAAKDAFDTSSFFDFGSPLNSQQGPGQSSGLPNRSFKSSSHEHMRSTFSAENWDGAAFFNSTSQNTDERGRSATREATDRTGHSADASNTEKPNPEPEPQPAPFAQFGFPADQWTEMFKNMSFEPKNGGGQQTQTASTQRQRSPRKPRAATKTRPVPQPATVTTEADEVPTTLNGETSIPDTAKAGNTGVEAMDIDDMPLRTTTEKPDETKKTDETVPATKPASHEAQKEENAKNFNLEDLSKTVPLTQNTNGGIEDLQDIHVTLPFESRADFPKTTTRDARPRRLNLPRPPKRPNVPEMIPLSAGSRQLGVPRAAWERYVAEMTVYMSEWNAFNRRMIQHFSARQDAIETGMSPNWIGAIGDAAQVKLDPEDPGNGDAMVAGSAKGGYNAYKLALDQDLEVEKHWEVARELHRDCISKLGELREWIMADGKIL
ncbi:DnaJ domain protein [Aspergillus homomorphus CBS 101889]|uniref:J domain-containing protein n=1 Tax=Aspergillus homomorphus (strain CBS 101889) TaxID=1450537 RepID=A0A395I9W5_ASPHC|nr:hypothetical protein BO97DRAFT_439722 [Aspergillus homomorphus CBS 101889]RAL16755.1 hypothetical protein BO97DRAFT_439722 [Aspergillus homomorphus CBS 101889]